MTDTTAADATAADRALGNDTVRRFMVFIVPPRSTASDRLSRAGHERAGRFRPSE
ncbi:hypothetical protein [Streptomyces atratus]|uniref:hypothetical protein n=1 Tax=Streptomyces atratus TaxID=1893 RepID=UPI002259A6A5|nr:hypothetical protein [Streptomyces atratus]MCX5338594.1 hypothetical protein [Streptomyces atratus]